MEAESAVVVSCPWSTTLSVDSRYDILAPRLVGSPHVEWCGMV